MCNGSTVTHHHINIHNQHNTFNTMGSTLQYHVVKIYLLIIALSFNFILKANAVSKFPIESERPEIPHTKSARYLYNITEDPYEDVNVIHDEKYSKILKVLEDRRLYWSEMTIPSSSKIIVVNRS